MTRLAVLLLAVAISGCAPKPAPAVVTPEPISQPVHPPELIVLCEGLEKYRDAYLARLEPNEVGYVCYSDTIYGQDYCKLDGIADKQRYDDVAKAVSMAHPGRKVYLFLVPVPLTVGYEEADAIPMASAVAR